MRDRGCGAREAGRSRGRVGWRVAWGPVGGELEGGSKKRNYQDSAVPGCEL